MVILSGKNAMSSPTTAPTTTAAAAPSAAAAVVAAAAAAAAANQYLNPDYLSPMSSEVSFMRRPRRT